jgi:hypothetical protein
MLSEFWKWEVEGWKRLLNKTPISLFLMAGSVVGVSVDGRDRAPIPATFPSVLGEREKVGDKSETESDGCRL